MAKHEYCVIAVLPLEGGLFSTQEASTVVTSPHTLEMGTGPCEDEILGGQQPLFRPLTERWVSDRTRASPMREVWTYDGDGLYVTHPFVRHRTVVGFESTVLSPSDREMSCTRGRGSQMIQSETNGTAACSLCLVPHVGLSL